MKLARQKRARKYDWHWYDSPKDRLDLWDGIMLNVFTSARVGEYIESTAREGTGRGLRYKVSFLQRSMVYRDSHYNNQDVLYINVVSHLYGSTRWRK